MDIDAYYHIRSGGAGFIEMARGLIAVWGKESVQFLDGLITNDMKTLEDGGQMLAAFPNAQGRLLAAVRVLRQGDRFLFETEEATREKVFNNLFRFTFAGDFFVEDISNNYRFVELFGLREDPPSAIGFSEEKFKAYSEFGFHFAGPAKTVLGAIKIDAGPVRKGDDLLEISDELYETLRIESGIPLYGVDMDENTIVPELGLDGLISYTKGCYIGQEIIARIHFRGHVAKQLTGLILSGSGNIEAGCELTSADGKNAGRITSVTYSPKLEKTIALGYVRYDFLEPGTMLRSGEADFEVADLPFI